MDIAFQYLEGHAVVKKVAPLHYGAPRYITPDGLHIDCILEHPGLGQTDFTASRDDPEPHGRAIYEAILAGETPIAPYVAPGPAVSGDPPERLA